MYKIMSLDIGTKRIGIALSDFLHVIATGHSCVERNLQAVENIRKIALENKVEKIIVGLPLNMDDTKGFQANDCIAFAKNFEKDFEIIYEDERLSSDWAEANLRSRNVDFRKKKELVDIESACIILEQYLFRKP
jgi:putative holliday junction resolvase